MTSQTSAAEPIALKDLAALLGIEPPETDVEIAGVATIDAAGPNELTFLANDRYVGKLRDSQAGAVLVASDFDGEVPMPALRTKLPRLAFARAVAHFHPTKPHAPGIHPTAVVPESCTLGQDVFIGAYTVLGENVTLGDRVAVHPHCVLYDEVVVGDDSVIHSHVSLRESIRLGKNVVVQNGAMIGTDGFGFEPDERGHLQRVPQVGSVEIGDDVDIQANACVDRSALGPTRVGTGAKIDNLAQIAHGCTVGDHAVICGQVGLAGSTHVGNHAMLGGQVGCSGHIHIGDGAQVAAKTGVISDLEGGKSYGGTPAVELKEAIRLALYVSRLPATAKQIKKLERTVAKLEAQLAED